MPPKNKNLTTAHGSDMQRVILCYFGILGFACLFVLYGSLLGIVVGTNSALQNDITLDLNAQMKGQAFSTLSEAGDFLTRVLNGYDQAVANNTALATSNVLRSNMYEPNLGQPTNYWDMEGGKGSLLNAINTDPRFPGQWISLNASAAYVMTPSGSPNITFGNKNTWYNCTLNNPTGTTQTEADHCAKLEKLIGSTTYLDPLMKTSWETYDDLIQMYVGFDTTPPSLRRYPGRDSHSPDGKLVGSGMRYNCTGRDWYRAAEAAKPDTIVTEPYEDFHGLGWMITIAKAVYDYKIPIDYATDTPIGVVGLDVLIKDIAVVMNDIKFLKTGSLTLFTNANCDGNLGLANPACGQVVTDQEWDFENSNTGVFTYRNKASPAVSADIWKEIYDTAVGGSKEIITYTDIEEEKGKQLIFVERLSDYDGQFYLAVFVKDEEVMEPVQPSIDEMNDANNVVSGVLVAALFASMILLMALMFVLIKSIVKVFNKMQENVEQLLRNVGTGRGLGDGMVEVNDYASEELQTLESSMNTMIHQLQKQRSAQFIEVPKEEGTKKTQSDQLSELWNIVPMAEDVKNQETPIDKAFVFDGAPAPPPAYS